VEKITIEAICEGANTIVLELLWRADFHAVVELFAITAFLIIGYKAYRKKRPALWRLRDFRLEIALLLPTAITQGVRAIWVLACWLQ